MNDNKTSKNEKQKLASGSRLIAAQNLNQKETDFVPSSDEVDRRAYFSYVNQGSPSGREVQHWLAAEAQLLAERKLTRTHGFHNKT